MKINEEPLGKFKKKCEHWLQDKIIKTKNRLTEAQAQYKNNYDARLRKQQKVINLYDHLYLRVKRKNTDEHYHKLAQIAEGLYKVIKVDENTVVIEKTDQSV